MPPVESVAAIPNDLIWRLSIEQYHAIIQAGILTDEEQVEVYSQPLVEVEQPDYSQRLDFGRSAVIPIIIEGREIGAIAVDALVP